MQATKRFRRVGLTVLSATVAALTLSIAALASGPTWASLAPVPAATEGMQVGVVLDKIVAAYGFSGGDTNLTRIYNPSTNTWSAGATAPGPGRSEGAAVTVGRDFYAVGGRPIGSAGNRLERYSLGTNTWVTLASMPTPRAGLGAAAIGGAIYAIGGRSSSGPCGGGELDTVERYNVGSNTWTTLAPLPVPLSDIAAIDYGRKIFVFGGCNGEDPGNTVYIYDTPSNTWSAGTPMPRNRAALYGVGKKDSQIYVMGGITDTLLDRATIDVYGASVNTWTTLPATANMPDPRGEMGVVSFGARIYTIGGAHPAMGSSSATNDVFTP